MGESRYWSVEHCRWESTDARPVVFWSVQRCCWEPSGPGVDALATPWSMFAAAVPAQRSPQPAPAPG